MRGAIFFLARISKRNTAGNLIREQQSSESQAGKSALMSGRGSPMMQSYLYMVT